MFNNNFTVNLLLKNLSIKNFKNWLAFSEVAGKSTVSCYWLTV